MPSPPEPRVTRWEDRTALPLALVSVLFLAAFAWPVLDPQLDHRFAYAFHVVNLVTWLVFVVDYAVRVTLATHKLAYVLHHLLDLAAVLLPVLRPLRLLRVVLLLKVIDRQVAATLRGRVAVYTLATTALMVFSGAVAELGAERGHLHSNIHTFGTALWWACVTVTTVGYGDHYPVTTSGRLIAVLLMVGGVALIGVVTASIASWFVEHVRGAGTVEEEADLVALRREIRELREELRARGEVS